MDLLRDGERPYAAWISRPQGAFGDVRLFAAALADYAFPVLNAGYERRTGNWKRETSKKRQLTAAHLRKRPQPLSESLKIFNDICRIDDKNIYPVEYAQNIIPGQLEVSRKKHGSALMAKGESEASHVLAPRVYWVRMKAI
jgi:hypothetical protein